MKKLLWVIPACFILFSACIPAKPPTPDTGPVMDVTVGQEFNVNLASNPTTGYHWALAKALDHKLLKLVNTQFQPSPGSQNRVGTGGREVWTFRAVGEGYTVIEFKIRPGVGKGQAPGQAAHPAGARAQE